MLTRPSMRTGTHIKKQLMLLPRRCSTASTVPQRSSDYRSACTSPGDPRVFVLHAGVSIQGVARLQASPHRRRRQPAVLGDRVCRDGQAALQRIAVSGMAARRPMGFAGVGRQCSCLVRTVGRLSTLSIGPETDVSAVSGPGCIPGTGIDSSSFPPLLGALQGTAADRSLAVPDLAVQVRSPGSRPTPSARVPPQSRCFCTRVPALIRTLPAHTVGIVM